MSFGKLLQLGNDKITPLTLDEAWEEAAQLGGIRVWQSRRGATFNVTIQFRSSGGDIQAAAESNDIIVALRMASEKARRLQQVLGDDVSHAGLFG